MLKTLLDDQKIIVDAHQRGARERVIWDDTANDIHVDKITNWTVKGQRLQVRIRIPINSQRPISIEIQGKVKKRDKVIAIAERQLRNEINKALSDHNVRREFINDIIEIIDNYPSALTSIEKAANVIRRLSSHFGLSQQILEPLIEYVEDRITSFTAYYPLSTGVYFVKLTSSHFELGQQETKKISARSQRAGKR